MLDMCCMCWLLFITIYSHVHCKCYCSCTPAVTNCTSEEVLCPQGAISGIDRCIPRAYICDAVIDCVGGTDEEGCPG